ncbi:MAG: hypothetical protein ACE15E_20280 [Acidobacteriota bacterium]
MNFLKQYLVTAPANKVLTFGGDYFSVEPVVGHAALAAGWSWFCGSWSRKGG